MAGSFRRLVMLATALLCGWQTISAPGNSQAQQVQRLPHPDYYLVLTEYYGGNFDRALRDFRRVSNRAYRDFQGNHYLDSICYLTMIGECQFRMGNYAGALETYEQALALYSNLTAWPARTQFPDLRPSPNAVQRARISWGTPRRTGVVGAFPNSMSVMFGRMDVERVLSEGGVVAEPEWRPVDIVEVMRCTALAVHRRNQLLGVIASRHPGSAQLVARLSQNLAPEGTMAGAWQRVLLGVAHIGAGQPDAGVALLQRNVQLPGNVDHPLTPLALIHLASHEEREGNVERAGNLFLEASYSAAIFEQPDLVGESLARAAELLLVSRGEVLAALGPAAEWSNRNRARPLQASLLIQAAVCHLEVGNLTPANQALQQAQRSMSRTDLPTSIIGRRLAVIQALARCYAGDMARGLAELEAGLAQEPSTWLFQIRLAQSLATSGRITSREVASLYNELLRDPTPFDWRRRPVETFCYLTTPAPEPLYHWFEIALAQREISKAIEIADRIRRFRFYSYQPMGGRLLGLRWLVQAPDEMLSEAQRQQRDELVGRWPPLRELAIQSAELVEQLRQLPVVPEEGSDERRRQQQLVQQLQNVATTQEQLLVRIAVSRQPADLVFPPQRSLSSIQADMARDQAILTTVLSPSGCHIFLITATAADHLGTVVADDLRRQVSQLLLRLGLREHDAAIPVETFQDEAWRETASALLLNLTGSTSADDWQQIEQLVIVPDGFLWYLPFELLQVQADDGATHLGAVVPIRYAPTTSVAAGYQYAPRRVERTLVSVGKIHSRDDSDLPQAQFDALLDVAPEAHQADERLAAGGVAYAAATDQLVSWHEIAAAARLPWELVPLPAGRRAPATSLVQWSTLPWRGPQTVVLPGMTTSAALALRDLGDGNEIFMTACALYASGAQTALLSRWRTGGPSAYEITREFVTALRQLPADLAWQQAVAEMAQRELNSAAEPRIRTGRGDATVPADHPLFWAGYLLIDTGLGERGVDNPAE